MVLQWVPVWNMAAVLRSKSGIPFDYRGKLMTVHHLRKRRYDWKDIVDYETLWILTFSAVVLSSGIFALFSISQNHPYAFPRHGTPEG
jgi:hypothetical protein